MFEDQSVLLEHPHDDMSFCDASTGEFNIDSSYHDKDLDCSSMNVETYGSLLEAPRIREDMEFDPLPSGAASSVFFLHNEEDILQWHDVITDRFEDSNLVHYHSHEKEAHDHEQAKDMISFLDGNTTPIGGYEDIKRTDFVYFGIEESRRS